MSPYTTLVSTDELAAHPEWRLFDCRHELAKPDAGARAYAQGHIPGALHAHLDRDLSSPARPDVREGRHPLPELDQFTAWLGRLGVRPGDQVVAYDAGDGTYAGRLWWLLRAIGHEAVAVLDGGFARWQAEGRPVSTEVPAPTPASHEARWREGLTVNAAAVQQNLQRRGFTVLDARGSNRYEGRDETMDPVAGHIPGALNRPYAGNLEGGRFKSPERLREEFTALLGSTLPEQVVHQCGSGVSACCNLLAMEIAGLRGSRLYPGSWSDWVSDRTRPVATGPEPGSST